MAAHDMDIRAFEQLLHWSCTPRVGTPRVFVKEVISTPDLKGIYLADKLKMYETFGYALLSFLFWHRVCHTGDSRSLVRLALVNPYG